MGITNERLTDFVNEQPALPVPVHSRIPLPQPPDDGESGLSEGAGGCEGRRNMVLGHRLLQCVPSRRCDVHHLLCSV